MEKNQHPSAWISPNQHPSHLSEVERPPPKRGRSEKLNEPTAQPTPSSFHDRIKNILIIALIFAILLAGFAMLSMNKEGNACLENPFVYGANKAVTEDSGELFCSCHVENPSYAPFYFDNERVDLLQEYAP